ncbi:hypothetical protein A33M_2593 [Rhodovulum sp. PH10]|uniref:hypothetical protein n=1 Tax=Rhodovulum sp. PH10 TaxID=1187851 RepID=UPI00027C2016|nr:hypothetical protein [Rhodovulum sp. PH10]EJW11945.1 hypothetical protein A33M_2593 [Rhodovulum sp. PH10]
MIRTLTADLAHDVTGSTEPNILVRVVHGVADTIRQVRRMREDARRRFPELDI